jgi:hypothetical protein
VSTTPLGLNHNNKYYFPFRRGFGNILGKLGNTFIAIMNENEWEKWIIL